MTPVQGADNDYAASGLAAENADDDTRLRLLEAMADPVSAERFDLIDIRPDAECWEIGTGTGSIARLLAGRLPRGHVLATDVTPPSQPKDLPNVEVRQHDLTTDPIPRARFDIVHARAVLEHVPTWRTVLPSIVESLRPGGMLLIEGIDLTPALHSVYPELREAMTAVTTLMATQIGTDSTVVRQLPPILRNLGLAEVTLMAHPVIVGDHTAGDAFLRASLRQLGDHLHDLELLDKDSYAEVWNLLEGSGQMDVAALLTGVSARLTTGAPTPVSQTADSAPSNGM